MITTLTKPFSCAANQEDFKSVEAWCNQWSCLLWSTSRIGDDGVKASAVIWWWKSQDVLEAQIFGTSCKEQYPWRFTPGVPLPWCVWSVTRLCVTTLCPDRALHRSWPPGDWKDWIVMPMFEVWILFIHLPKHLRFLSTSKAQIYKTKHTNITTLTLEYLTKGRQFMYALWHKLWPIRTWGQKWFGNNTLLYCVTWWAEQIRYA
jgi:hypothetical protein